MLESIESLLPTPAEVAAKRQQPRPEEVRLLRDIAQRLEDRESWPLFVYEYEFDSCRRPQVIAAIESRGWAVTAVSDRNEVYYEIRPASE